MTLHNRFIAVVAAALVALPCAAQTSAADIAAYSGADREQKLLEGAKK